MNERKPYFLYAALAVPALWIAYIILAGFMGALWGARASGDLGNWGEAMIIMLGLLAASDIVGVICSGISVARRERYRRVGLLCLGLYSIPLVLAAFMAILQFGASRGQQVINQQAQPHPLSTSR